MRVSLTTHRLAISTAALLLGFAVAGCAAKATPEQMEHAAAAKTLSGAEIESTLVGNTISGISDKGPTYEETYIADGSIRGLWKGSEKYTGKWRLDGDKLCVDYDGSDDSDGCSGMSLNRSMLYWLSEDGSAWNPSRPATLTQGNPSNL